MKYIYVMAYRDNGVLAFKHINVEAESESEAYRKGSKELLPTIPEKSAENDYVILQP